MEQNVLDETSDSNKQEIMYQEKDFFRFAFK